MVSVLSPLQLLSAAPSSSCTSPTQARGLSCGVPLFRIAPRQVLSMDRITFPHFDLSLPTFKHVATYHLITASVQCRSVIKCSVLLLSHPEGLVY